MSRKRFYAKVKGWTVALLVSVSLIGSPVAMIPQAQAASANIAYTQIQGFAPALTATAGTALVAMVPPVKNTVAHLLSCVYTVGTTQHQLICMRPCGITTVASAAAASQAVVNFTADPGAAPLGPNGTASQLAANPIAANDLVVIELPDGTFWQAKVSSVSTLAITMTANVPTNGIAAGATVWWFGISTDTNPRDPTAKAHPSFSMFAAGSGTQQITIGNVAADDCGGVCSSLGRYEPMLLFSGNGTVAGTIEHYVVGYSDR